MMKEQWESVSGAILESPLTVVYLLAGLLLLLAGLYIFKAVQFVIGALIGGLLGMAVLDVTGHGEQIWLAAIPALIVGILAVWKYKIALFFAGSLCTFAAVGLWFVKRALAEVRESISAIPDADTLLKLWIAQAKEKGDLAAAAESVLGGQSARLLEEAEAALKLLEQGALAALLAGVVVGVLALLLGDYIIILFTAASGAVLAVSMVDRLYPMEGQIFNRVLGIMLAVGVAAQCIHKWDRKNVKKEHFSS